MTMNKVIKSPFELIQKGAVAILCVLLMIIGCKKSNSSLETMLLYEKAELGGCNITASLRSGVLETKGSGIDISVTKESVNVFVCLNYECKAIVPFETKVETIDNIVYIYLIDTGGDYYRCFCDYTFDFIFKRENTATLNQKFEILLIDPRKELPVLLYEGVIVDE